MSGRKEENFETSNFVELLTFAYNKEQIRRYSFSLNILFR